ncbi:hypothetical protein OG625_30225 [Streptomyces sp. NBC_01351]|uniref:hypothetical protein n=1 Tax=Streptomyces sp. NBC_01351 TaxID=2903833 RepID=UPI002E350F97|nr:hypothetical protein [Streptomyces sp. NBC_01351]
MVQSRHPRAAAWAAAAVLLVVPALTGCSSDSGSGSDATAGGSAAASPASAGAPSTPIVGEPADPAAAKAEIEKNWVLFFDPKASTEAKAEVLEHGDLMEPLLSGFANLPNADKTSVKVENIAFTSPTEATVTYDLLVAGSPALSDSKGIAVLDDGVWKVSLKSLCGLIELSGNAAPPPC